MKRFCYDNDILRVYLSTCHLDCVLIHKKFIKNISYLNYASHQLKSCLNFNFLLNFNENKVLKFFIMFKSNCEIHIYFTENELLIINLYD